MKLGVYTAILHDRPLREALEVIASLGLTGARSTQVGSYLHRTSLFTNCCQARSRRSSTCPLSTALVCRSPG